MDDQNNQPQPTSPTSDNPVPPSAPAAPPYNPVPGPNPTASPSPPQFGPASQTLQTPQPSAPASGYPPVTPKSKTPIIMIAGGAVVLVLLLALILLSLGKKDDSPKATPSGSSTSDSRDDKSFSATNLGDLDKVCEGGVATNTTAYSSGPSPHPIVLFTPSNVNADSLVEESVTFKDRTWRADSSNVDAAQLVGCFKRTSTGTSKKCDFRSGGQPVSVDYLSATYELTIREAKTGKSLGTKEVNGPNLTCPFVSTYNKADPKIYASPDDGLTEAAVREFVVR